jgi:type I restriction enzyme R subunit
LDLRKPSGVRLISKELTEQLRKNRTIDWNRKESSRAKMRVLVKRLLKKYKYPPEGQEKALEVVMAQCNKWADDEENFEAPHTIKFYPQAEEDNAMLMAAENEANFTKDNYK